MQHYVTLFDSGFLPQGLALHASLLRHSGSFTLWILCMDDEAKSTLDRLSLPSIKTIALADIETAALLFVKPGRNRAEYCWTLTPFTPKIVFDRDSSVRQVTYVDSDMYFFKSPSPIFEEFAASGKSVLITDHAYHPDYDSSADSGQYCVQFMTFVRDSSDTVRQWWEDRCVEWCFDRIEDGKLGDQKYLDDWTTRFKSDVHVLSQLDVLLAPWNARRFPYSRAIAWHFQGFRLLGNDRALLYRGYTVPDVVKKMVYGPYLAEMRRVLTQVGRPVQQKASKRAATIGLRASLRRIRSLFREVFEYEVVGNLPRK